MRLGSKLCLLFGLAAAVAATPAVGQTPDPAAACREPGLDERAREICFAVAQAAQSAQPQLGLLITGGNPVLGAASPAGLRLGALPRMNLTGRLNLVFVRLPDILLEQTGGELRRVNEAIGIPAPALGGSATVGVLPGFSVMPGVGGIGSLDLLGSGTWLPFSLLGVDGFEEGGRDFAWGAGARLGLLRESFLVPGVSFSSMYHRLGRAQFGDVCPRRRLDGSCDGTSGEFAFDLNTWSHRLVVGKRFLGFGLLGGVGYDRHDSEVDFAFVQPQLLGDRVQRERVDLDASRWSAFVNTSYTFLVGTLSLEAGWQQGGDPLPGYDPATSGFDPGRGTFFGSLGVRLAF